MLVYHRVIQLFAMYFIGMDGYPKYRKGGPRLELVYKPHQLLP